MGTPAGTTGTAMATGMGRETGGVKPSPLGEREKELENERENASALFFVQRAGTTFAIAFFTCARKVTSPLGAFFTPTFSS